MSDEIENKVEISRSENLVLHEENLEKPKIVNIYADLFQLLTTTKEVDNIIQNVLKINIDDSTKNNINKVLLILTNNNVNFLSPLKNIIDDLKEILVDNKIDLYDIPLIIKILTDIFNLEYKNLKNTKKRPMLIVKFIILIISSINDFVTWLNNDFFYTELLKINTNQKNNKVYKSIFFTIIS